MSIAVRSHIGQTISIQQCTNMLMWYIRKGFSLLLRSVSHLPSWSELNGWGYKLYYVYLRFMFINAKVGRTLAMITIFGRGLTATSTRQHLLILSFKQQIIQPILNEHTAETLFRIRKKDSTFSAPFSVSDQTRYRRCWGLWGIIFNWRSDRENDSLWILLRHLWKLFMLLRIPFCAGP